MAKLPINLCGYIFQKGLGDIRSAYEATIMALESNRAKLASDLADFERAVSAGETGAWEYDEYGEVLYSRERLHELLIKDATSAITVAREAYGVILHHYWEKRCKEWMRLSDYKYSQAYQDLRSHGLAIDQSNLETLRETCNTIKHEIQPLNIFPYQVDQMFEAVKISGIQIDSPFVPS
jgi:hypothetical protein